MKRRHFIKGAAASAFAFHIVPAHVLGQNASSNKLNIAAVGVGGMGGANLRACESENIVALCDVDTQYAQHTFEKYPKAKTYKDFRVMFDKEKDIDAVIVATPDHSHAVVTMAAIEAGKHVFCQKPLCHTVRETRIITEAARKAGVQTQMGNQGHSDDAIRRLKEFVDDGAIGPVTEVHAWTDRPVGGNPWSTFPVVARPYEFVNVPKHLDWNLWLGPVAERPYHPEYHPSTWRGWYDFGTGSLGDMGCHILDPAFWVLDLGSPTRVQATSTHWKPEVSAETYPRASIVRYDFPARGDKPPVKLTWYDGRLKPPIPEGFESGRRTPDSGAILIGEKGYIMHGSHGAGGMRIVPETAMKAYTQPPESLPRIREGHEGDWIRACKEGKGGRPASSSFEYGGPLTEMVLLGVAAIRAKDQRLEWDAQAMQFKNNEEVSRLLHIDYRSGWRL